MGTYQTIDERRRMLGQVQQGQTDQAQQPVQPTQQTQQQPVQQNQQPVQQTQQSQQARANVAGAQQLLQQGLESTGGSYQSRWTEKLNGLLDKITNRQPFQYDVNADALYQMYKDQYVRQGRMAMQDTMGQAAAMTGGYGNSYAQNAGQQAYEGYLQQLTGKIPELYKTAYDQYAQEGQELYNQYNLLGNRDAADYDRFANERNYQYTLDQNAQKLAQGQVDYLLSLGVKPNEELLKAAGYDSQYVGEILSRTQQPQGSGYGGSGGSGGGKDTGTGRNVDLITEAAAVADAMGSGSALKYIQEQLGTSSNKRLKSQEAVMAWDNAKGVAQTEHYKKLLAGQSKKK
nr:MAG TPA: hypothetical protein [Caudoviricetes sp.]